MILSFSKFFLLILSIFLLSSKASYSLSPETRLANSQDEALAHEIFVQVRCLICSGQVIESSDNEFASSMRQLIREKIALGLNEKQIKEFLVRKYGEDILLEANYKSKNILLWFLPIIFGFIFIFSFIRFFR